MANRYRPQEPTDWLLVLVYLAAFAVVLADSIIWRS